MTHDPFTAFDRNPTTPGILARIPARRQPQSTTGPSRFVTQSHAVSAPALNPRALVLAAMIAAGLVVIARRSSG
jgi:preprotein translocase subunit Sec61beta